MERSPCVLLPSRSWWCWCLRCLPSNPKKEVAPPLTIRGYLADQKANRELVEKVREDKTLTSAGLDEATKKASEPFRTKYPKTTVWKDTLTVWNVVDATQTVGNNYYVIDLNLVEDGKVVHNVRVGTADKKYAMSLKKGDEVTLSWKAGTVAGNELQFPNGVYIPPQPVKK